MTIVAASCGEVPDSLDACNEKYATDVAGAAFYVNLSCSEIISGRAKEGTAAYAVHLCVLRNMEDAKRPPETTQLLNRCLKDHQDKHDRFQLP